MHILAWIVVIYEMISALLRCIGVIAAKTATDRFVSLMCVIEYIVIIYVIMSGVIF